MTQQSINIGRQHQNPIPNTCRIEPFVMTSVLIGANPDTAELPPDLDSQCVNLFTSNRQLWERAGGSKFN